MTSAGSETPGWVTFARETLARVPGARTLKRAVVEVLASPEDRPLLRAYDIGMTQNRAEISSLASLVRELQPSCVVEIGTASGGTLYLWTRLATADATLVSIDLPWPWATEASEVATLEKLRSFRRDRQVLHCLRKDSHASQTHGEVEAAVTGKPVEFLFIDGDHSYEGVRSDFLLYGPLVRPGGLIAFHDTVPHSEGLGGEVPRFWAEVKAKYAGVDFIETPGQDGFGIGVIRVPVTHRVGEQA
jgi:predicted O-methyltransferase YrrM